MHYYLMGKAGFRYGREHLMTFQTDNEWYISTWDLYTIILNLNMLISIQFE